VRVAFSAAEERFRGEVVAFLADWKHLDGFFTQGHRWPEVCALFRAMGARGWLSLGWPEREGGLARSPSFEYLLWDEVAYARAARNPLSAGIVARTLLRHGSEEQRRRFLPGIRAGEIHFSLGYSEPEAGSDLAALRTRAERRGDVYVVTGHKCWQSYARDSDYLWLLARTGAPESRGDGLSLLILDLRAPGVEVRELPIVDDHPLCEVRLDGAEVPVADRVGPEHGAWRLIGEALADERHIQFPPKRVRRDLEDVAAFMDGRGLARDPAVRRGLAELAVLALEVEMHGLRVLDAMQRGRAAGVEAAANKVVHTVACQRIARAAAEWGGPEALVRGTQLERLWRQTLWETIGGGTSEVMRGVVARQGLGLGSRA
jgi:alkylation response protein AidB-like acyl-CoA dehydrogenase